MDRDRYLALPETNERIELIDGSLLASPSAAWVHQRYARWLANLIEAAVGDDLGVNENVNVRVAPNRILIPDVVVARVDDDPVILDPSQVVLVCEVMSPSGVTSDRVITPQMYEAAGIGLYLRVELKPEPVMYLYRLEAGRYVQVGVAGPGELLTVPQPCAMTLDPAAPLRRRR